MIKLFKNRCYNGGMKHKFQPRYTEKARHTNVKVKNIDPEDLRKLLYSNEYVYDVCEWCAKIVKKDI